MGRMGGANRSPMLSYFRRLASGTGRVGRWCRSMRTCNPQCLHQRLCEAEGHHLRHLELEAPAKENWVWVTRWAGVSLCESASALRRCDPCAGRECHNRQQPTTAQLAHASTHPQPPKPHLSNTTLKSMFTRWQPRRCSSMLSRWRSPRPRRWPTCGRSGRSDSQCGVVRCGPCQRREWPRRRQLGRRHEDPT